MTVVLGARDGRQTRTRRKRTEVDERRSVGEEEGRRRRSRERLKRDRVTMGIKGLTALLTDNAPGCSREQKFESYLDRKVAIDASMHIYQFMVRARDFV